MTARLATRNLRTRINLARWAAAPEKRISGCARMGREFAFYVRHERNRSAR